MPITVTAPLGTLTPAGEREILPRLTVALIEVSGVAGNPFSTPIVGGTLHRLDPHDIYAGGVNRPVVMIELKLPDIGLSTVEARAAFIAAATTSSSTARCPGTTEMTSGSTSSTPRTARGASAAAATRVRRWSPPGGRDLTAAAPRAPDPPDGTHDAGTR